MAITRSQRLRQRVFLAYSRLTRGMTLGVRAMLLKDEHVMLVRHSYVSGWYFPGGGVEAGESVREALVREMREEAGAVLTGPAELFGLYRNAHADVRDHVALFVCRAWERRGSARIAEPRDRGLRALSARRAARRDAARERERASARCSAASRRPPTGRRDQRCGRFVPRKRSRSCGASMIRSGPSGTMRVGLMRSWL